MLAKWTQSVRKKRLAAAGVWMLAVMVLLTSAATQAQEPAEEAVAETKTEEAEAEEAPAKSA